MPNKTDAEWRELDEQLAREVMGRRKWDDIPEPDRKELRERQDGGFDYLAAGFSASEYEAFCLATHRDFWWERYSEHGWTHAYDCRGWQPHEDVAQALGGRDKIVQQGWDFVLGAALGKQLQIFVTAAFAPEAGVGLFESDRSANTDAKAICLAIERWLNVQKEVQGELD